MRTIFAALLAAAGAYAQQYDLVIANGRVMDPASNTDAIRHVGIRAGKIAAVSAQPLRGRTTIDAKGLVVAPGFIDLHSHGQTPESYRYKAKDGVTTALEMEVGVSPVPEWYRARGSRLDAPYRRRAAENAEGNAEKQLRLFSLRILCVLRVSAIKGQSAGEFRRDCGTLACAHGRDA